MAGFHHAVRQSGAIPLRLEKPSALFEADIELLEVSGGKLNQRDLSNFRNDVLVDAVFIVCLGLGADRWLTVTPIPVIQPCPEGHAGFGLLWLGTVDAVPQCLELFLALPAGSRQDIFGFGQALFIAADDHPALPAAVLSQVDAAVSALIFLLSHERLP